MVRVVPRSGGTFEYLRAEIDYAGVVGRSTQLKPERGGTVLVGSCPLVEQRSGNPAFKIYPGGWAHCFSCGFHGDVTRFWQVKHGISTSLEAAQDLAREFGLRLPEMDPATQVRYEERRRKEEDASETAKANYARLLDPDKGRAARGYLEGRGFGSDLQERFLLGVKPDGNISIPYWSTGRVHGVVTRKVDGSTPKYLYPRSEDLPLGRKPLFATEYPRTGEYVLVEGVLDQLALTAMGVASIGFGGSAPSKEQLKDFLDLGNKGCTFVVLPDNDETGRAKARETVERLYPYARLASPLEEGEPGKTEQTATSPRDRAWWESNASAPFMSTVDEIAKYCIQDIGPSRVDYSAQSYVSLKKGRRAWLPMWPRTNGAYVYLPGGANGSADSPSDFFSQVQAKLEAIGLESPTWTYKYNGGANPVGFAIPRDRATHSAIKEILTVAYELA